MWWNPPIRLFTYLPISFTYNCRYIHVYLFAYGVKFTYLPISFTYKCLYTYIFIYICWPTYRSTYFVIYQFTYEFGEEFTYLPFYLFHLPINFDITMFNYLPMWWNFPMSIFTYLPISFTYNCWYTHVYTFA